MALLAVGLAARAAGGQGVESDLSATVPAQGAVLRYSTHRRVEVPSYALVRIGPFYSNVAFSQSAGYRYTRSSGTGTDFLYANRRGKIIEDGQEFPLISALDMRNYLVVSPHMDVDASVRVSYEHYPLKTQEDAFNVDLPKGEGGIQANLSTEFEPGPFMKGRAQDTMYYRTDYLDVRGYTDEYGGKKYQHFNNNLGVNIDWLAAPDRNVMLAVGREDSIPLTDEFEDQKRVSYTESAAVEQQFSPALVGGVRGDWNQNDFADRDRADSYIQQYSLFGRARITQQSAASASLGYGIATVSSPGPGKEQGSRSVIGGVAVRTDFQPGLWHSLGCTRSMQAGFRSAYETIDHLDYQLEWSGAKNWTGLPIHAHFQTGWGIVRPSDRDMNGYRDWTSVVQMAYPWLSFATLNLDSTYSVRNNEETGSDANADPETMSDYSTWSTRLGTGFAVMKEVNFSTSVQHIQRRSDSADLDFDRDVFEAEFTYSHQF